MTVFRCLIVLLICVLVPASASAQLVECVDPPCVEEPSFPKLKFEFDIKLKPNIRPRPRPPKPKVTQPKKPIVKPKPKVFVVKKPVERPVVVTKSEPKVAVYSKPLAQPPKPLVQPPKPKAKVIETKPRPTPKQRRSKSVPESWRGLSEMPVVVLDDSDLADIPNQFVLSLNSQATAAAGIDIATIALDDLASRLGLQPGQVLSIQRRFLMTAVVQANPRQAANLQQNPIVTALESDTYIKAANQKRPLSWGLDRLDSPVLPLDGKFDRAAGDYKTRVYLFDSDIDGWPSEFDSRIVVGGDFVQANRLTDDGKRKKCKEHGTEMASLIAGRTTGAAPKAEITSLIVLPCERDGVGRASSILEAVEWLLQRELELADEKPAIANMSLIGKKRGFINDAVKILFASNIVVVAAAGNNGKDACNFSPASASEAVTVGATGPRDEIASFSNFGSCVDIHAPGRLVTAITEDNKDRYVTVSGTSGAAALVSGLLARSMSSKGSTAAHEWLSQVAIPSVFWRKNDAALSMIQSSGEGRALCRANVVPGGLALRASATPKADIVQVIADGELVLIEGRSGFWLKTIATGGARGFLPLQSQGANSLRNPDNNKPCQLSK